MRTPEEIQSTVDMLMVMTFFFVAISVFFVVGTILLVAGLILAEKWGLR